MNRGQRRYVFIIRLNLLQIQCVNLVTPAENTYIAGFVTKEKRKKLNLKNTTEHPRNPPAEFKLKVLRRCFENGESVNLVSEETGYSRVSIYVWRK